MERIRFYYHEKGNHDETWHYLRDDYGALHIETETSAGPGRGSGEITEPLKRSVDEFLASGKGTAQDNLRALLVKMGVHDA